MTDAFHHLPHPDATEAARRVRRRGDDRPGHALTRLIYTRLHHEPFNPGR
jgi:hypothetical protein